MSDLNNEATLYYYNIDPDYADLDERMAIHDWLFDQLLLACPLAGPNDGKYGVFVDIFRKTRFNGPTLLGSLTWKDVLDHPTNVESPTMDKNELLNAWFQILRDRPEMNQAANKVLEFLDHKSCAGFFQFNDGAFICNVFKGPEIFDKKLDECFCDLNAIFRGEKHDAYCPFA